MEVDPKLKSAVLKLKSGNNEDFGEIYAKTYNYVYFRARQIMNNEDDAMDLLQIVYMEAYKSIDSLDKVESIYSWLSSITFRQGMKLFHKNKEILLDEDFENIFDSMETSDRDSNPEHSFEKKERQKLLADLIDSLPEVQRATIVAFYYDNIKIEEIAEVMDCSVGTVKSRLSYARQALKKKLQALDSKNPNSGVGKMALTGALLFGAVQVMSEETVLAAPVAMGAFGSICSGLGIVGAGTAIAGTALAGGAGVSAATGSAAGTAAATAGTTAAGTAAATAGTTAAGTAAATAGTTAAGTAAAAATAAAGTAATVGTAAAGTAAGTAATAVGTAAAAGTAATAATAAAGTAAAGTAAAAGSTIAGTVAAGGAAKGIAVAVAVAVAGTGGTVGTTIYRNSVSSQNEVSVNAEQESSIPDTVTENEAVSADEITDDIVSEEKEELIAVDPEKDESVQDETDSAEETGDTAEETGDTAEPGTEEEEIKEEENGEAVSDNAAADEDKKDSVSENRPVSVVYELSKKASEHISEAAASLFMSGNCVPFSGNISDDMLEAAYILEGGRIISDKEIKSLSSNKVFLSDPYISSAEIEDGSVAVKGAFKAGRTDEFGNMTVESFAFDLKGIDLSEKGVFGRFHSTAIAYVFEGSEYIANPNSISANAVVSKNEIPLTATAPVIPEETVEVPPADIPEAETPDGVLPDAVTPGTDPMNEAMPDPVVPDAVVPDAVVPDAVVPDAVLPETAEEKSGDSVLYLEPVPETVSDIGI